MQKTLNIYLKKNVRNGFEINLAKTVFSIRKIPKKNSLISYLISNIKKIKKYLLKNLTQ